MGRRAGVEVVGARARRVRCARRSRRLRLFLMVSGMRVLRRRTYHCMQITIVSTQVRVAAAGQIQITVAVWVRCRFLECIRWFLANSIRSLPYFLIFVVVVIIANRFAGLPVILNGVIRCLILSTASKMKLAYVKNTNLEAWKLKWFFSILAWMISSNSLLCRLPERFLVCLRSRCSLRGGGWRWWRGWMTAVGLRSGTVVLCSPEHDDFEDKSSSGDNLSLWSSSLWGAQSGCVTLTDIGTSFRRRLCASLRSRWLRDLPFSGTTVNRTCMVLDP